MSEVADYWFSVRCVFASGWPAAGDVPAYEERMTLWRAASLDDAIERAEEEAREYASTIKESPGTYLGLAQAYMLADEPGDGAEIFSLVRRSKLPHDEYLDAFFDTGDEFQREDD